jgi:hypothetical protein
MALNQQLIVRYKHYVNHDQQSKHVAQINSLNADTAEPFNAEVDAASSFSIGGEVKGYLAKCNEAAKAKLEALPEVCPAQSRPDPASSQSPRFSRLNRFSTTSML